MATTYTPDTAAVQHWDSKYFREYLNSNFFKQFMGTGSGSMIQVNEQLTKRPGDTVTFQLVNKLSGTAASQNDTLEGNEEAMDIRTHAVTIREYAHATAWKKFEGQRSAIDFRNAHRDVLMDWNMELDRDLIIAAMGDINGVSYSSATEVQKDAWLTDNSDRVLFGDALGNTESDFDHSDSLAAITSGMTLDTAAITLMKRMAKTANPKIRPIKPKNRIDGSDSYVLFAPTQMVRDFAAESNVIAAHQDARSRGMDNPLFTGAKYIWENIYIYEIEDIPSLGGVGDGGGVVRPCYLCGAQALGVAWAKRPETVDEDFDYGRRMGLAISQWYKIEKLRFGSSASSDTGDLKDHGIVTGYFAAAADA